MSVSFQTFERKVTAAGLIAVDCGHWHWQIKGGERLVNIWPLAKHGPTLYVQGDSNGQHATPRKAIRLAGKPTERKDLRQHVVALELEVADLRDALMDLTEHLYVRREKKR